MLTSRFDHAFLYAQELHRTQTRKGTDTPYISHLIAVAALVIEHGGDEDQAIAALLHDAAEDQGGEPTLAEIRRRFGEGVANIVADCTGSWIEPKPAWRPRKEQYLAALPTRPQRSLLVSLADKTHNAEAILSDYQNLGDKLWARFTGGAEGTRWYYRELAAFFEVELRSPLSKRLRRAVNEFTHPQVGLTHGRVAGIDVGGPRKGFHAVLLESGRPIATHKTRDATQMAEWCLKQGAQIVAVDAPCRWSKSGRSRSAEVLLRAEGIQSFVTPERERAHSHDNGFYLWLFEGERLYSALEGSHPLWLSPDAPPKDQRITLETFPHAVTCALAGKVLKKDMEQRRRLLASVGIHGKQLTGSDLVDAAMCAYVAHSALGWQCKSYGDPEGGFIVVPLASRLANGNRGLVPI